MRIRLTCFHVLKLSALLLMLMVSSAQARQLASVAHMDSAYSDYPYLRFVEYGDSLVMNDEDFFDVAGKVVFPVNKSSLNLSDQFLRELDEKVLPDINRDSLQLVQLIIRGAASPEGPVKLNQKLGSQRAQALFDFIQSRLAFPLSSRYFSLDVDIEDYSTLCLMMRRANDPDYGYVRALTDRYEGQPDQLKQKLQTARGGQLWNRLLKEYFPGLRTARIVLVFRRYVPVELEEEEPVVPELDPVVHEQSPVVLVEPGLPEVDSIAPVPVGTPAEPEPDTIPRREFLSTRRMATSLSVPPSTSLGGRTTTPTSISRSVTTRWSPVTTCAAAIWTLILRERVLPSVASTFRVMPIWASSASVSMPTAVG